MGGLSFDGFGMRVTLADLRGMRDVSCSRAVFGVISWALRPTELTLVPDTHK
jgi:hypothetical protein